jgi:hypothetical protein
MHQMKKEEFEKLHEKLKDSSMVVFAVFFPFTLYWLAMIAIDETYTFKGFWRIGKYFVIVLVVLMFFRISIRRKLNEMDNDD